MRMTGFVMCWFLASSMYWTVVEMTSDGPQEDLEDSSSTVTQFRSCFDGYRHGSLWIEQNCTLCTCNDGQTNCKPDPTCCERRDRKLNVTRYYRHGEQWRDGCSMCSCSNGVEQCPIKECLTVQPPRGPDLDCPYPHLVTDECGCRVLNCYNSCRVEEHANQGRLNHAKSNRHGQLWNEFNAKGKCVECLCIHGTKLCRPERKCPTNIDEDICSMSEWSSWDRCSQTCGHGTSTRHRVVLTKRMENSTCPPTTDMRLCYVRQCPDPEPPDNEVITNLKDKPGHLLVVRDNSGCRSVHRVKTTLCSKDKCKRFALHNRPIVEETIKVPMVCKNNGRPIHHKFFAQVKACGCMP